MYSQTISVDKALIKAKSLAKNGNFNQAKDVYKSVLLSFPKNLRALKALQSLTSSSQSIEHNTVPKNIIDQLVNLHDEGKFKDLVDQIEKVLKTFPRSSIIWNLNGAAQKALGKNTQALNSFREAFALNPISEKALFQIGNILNIQGKLDDSAKIYNKLLSINPNHIYAYNNLGKVLQDQGKFDDAIHIFKKALSLKPDYVNAHNNLGTVLKDQGKLNDAIDSYKKALSINPNYVISYNNIGTALKDQGNFDVAITYYKKALAIQPNFTQALFNIGVVLQVQDKFDAAIDVFKKVLLIDSDFLDPYIYMGDIFRTQKKFEESIDCYNKALVIKPNSIRALFKKGSVCKVQGKLDHAINIYDEVLVLEPNNFNAYNNIGTIKIEQLHFAEALEIFKKVISLNPDFALSHYNIGLIKGIISNYKEAIDAYGKALSLKPDFEIARAKMISMQAHICDWDGIESNRDLIPKLGIHKQEVMPFSLLSLEDNPESHKKRSKKLVKKRYLQKPILFNSKITKSDKLIRVGYFSSDFKEHPVAYLIAGIIEQHNRGDFEIFGYAIKGTKKDNLNTRLSQAFDVFKDISHINDQEAALLARKDAIDIAIDLNGFTQNSRTGIFAYRAAPIQINYLGYPGTMGADFIDYIIADKILIPEGSEKYYSEKPIYLPNTYMPTDNTREISTRSISRKEFGLLEDSFVFCCFNNNYKITSEEFDIWMRLLGKIKGSVLWLRKSNKWSESNFIKEAKKRGVDPSRLVFAGRAAMEEHLARHKLADLFLDTFNFNAHTTASEALWAGLPVITKAGKGFASRVASSLLKAIDLPELITETNKDYEALIMDLATNPDKLLKIREKLKNNLLSKPLFDTELYTKHLESGYKQAYAQYIKENKLKIINV